MPKKTTSSKSDFLTHDVRWQAACMLFIAGIILAVYFNALQFDFVNLDDGGYVTQNNHVTTGLSLKNISWAFGFSESANHFYWHPVTWISHMMDCQLFGLDAGMHHLMNIIFHMMNACLLFIIFHQMTGAKWQSAIIAVVFAVHPINVESVAWISERKNLLSTLFWMMSMLAYMYYVKKPSAGRYVFIMVPFILGLLAKPMLVTLPFVFLLMDFWPLKRFLLNNVNQSPSTVRESRGKSVFKLLTEKIPLLMISLLSVMISLYSVHATQQIVSAVSRSFDLRISNAIVSYIKYIGKLFWPKNIAVFYPFPDTIPLWQVASGASILVLVTAAGIWLRKKSPYLIVGWLWYLGTLFPVIGISQHGRWPEMADRWMYIPEIGLLIIIIWGGSVLLARLPGRKFMLLGLTAAVISMLAVTAKHQASYWENSTTLFKHTLNVTKNNTVAHFNLGIALSNTGNPEEAILHYQQALSIDPDHPDIHINLGNALAQKGDIERAIVHLTEALKMDNRNATAHYNLGKALTAAGRIDEAIAHFLAVLKIYPGNDKTSLNLGTLFARQGNLTEAVSCLRTAIALNPGNCLAYFNLSIMTQDIGTINKAIACYRSSGEFQNMDPDTHRKMETLRLLKNEVEGKAQRWKLKAQGAKVKG